MPDIYSDNFVTLKRTTMMKNNFMNFDNKTIKQFTSMTLLAILVASSSVGGLQNALPMAQASTNANLFVSAENSQFNNYFAGPQVIQVVVADPDINRLDQQYGEPVVTVNGKRLRMAQGTDGNWYAYFADRNQAFAAANTAELKGKGLNFGGFCAPTSSFSPKSGVTFTDTKGYAIANGGYGSINHTDITSTNAHGTTGIISTSNLPNCVGTGPTPNSPSYIMEHVIRENKTLNTNPSGFAASTTYENAWPIIQLYDFSAIPSTVTVDYQKNGGDQIVNLTFDRIPQNLITTTTDRNTYPQNSQVFVQVNDPQLNIDPTEDDSWTWGTSATNNTMYYEAFTRNGAADADGTIGMQNIMGNLTTMMFNHNGKLTYTTAAQGIPVTQFQANGKIIYSGLQRGSPASVRTLSIGLNSQPLTLVEQGGVNTGVFGNWDGGKKSEIVTVDSSTIRGQSSVVRYNDISTSIVGGFSFASLTQTAINNTWSSGQRIPVTLTDNDDNKNGKITERMFLWDPTYKRSTAMVIGTPFTLSSATPGSPSETAALVVKTTATQVSGQQGNFTFGTSATSFNATLQKNLAEDEAFSARPIFNFTNQTATNSPSINSGSALFVDLKTTMNTLLKTIHNSNANNAEGFKGFNFFNYDLRSFSSLNNPNAGGSISSVNVYLAYNATGTLVSHVSTGLPQDGLRLVSIANSTSLQDFINLSVNGTQVSQATVLTSNLFKIPKTAPIGLLFQFTTNGLVTLSTSGEPVVADFFSVGLIGDGTQNSQRINNGIYRYELEETGDNTGVFTGSNQYVMLNQLNVLDPNTYSNLRTIQHDVYFPAIQDMLQSEARAPQVTYLDLGQDGVNTQISAQQDILTHSGVVSFDSKTYMVGDTVTVTLNDADLNVDNDLIDVYSTVDTDNGTDPAQDMVGKAGLGNYSDGHPFGRLLDIEFGQNNFVWKKDSCEGQNTTANNGLASTGFSLVETGPSTGIFTGTFEIPNQVCISSDSLVNAQGQNIKVNYVDFRDDSGKLVEVSDNSGVQGTTGSIKLDKAVYPVPFGQISDFAASSQTSPNGRSIFPYHRDVISSTGIKSNEIISNGDVIVHVRVLDEELGGAPLASAGADANHGPVQFAITRQGSTVVLAYAGGPAVLPGVIITNETLSGTPSTSDVASARELGPMQEVTFNSGLYQADLPLRFTDGPPSSDCPKPSSWQSIDGSDLPTSTDQTHRFNNVAPSGQNYCIKQGDVLTVTYTDQSDASGNTQTVTDSSTFDLRNGVLQSDKSVYIIGSDMILTLVEPDLNLDSQTAETVPLDVIEWDSHAFKGTMGLLGGQSSSFDAKPSTFVETGKDTGIFQAIIKIPAQLNGNLLERGEQITLEYTDWGPAGTKIVGANSQDVDLTIYTSNFGATVELDQKVYTWTDRVYITVVAPDHNFDPNLIDIIGNSDENKVSISTRGNSISQYKLVETGVDTGIFTGYVILTGDANIKGTSGVDGQGLNPTGAGPTGAGPTDGFLPAEEQDGVSVSFEFTRDQTVTGSALIRWNIGEIKWLEASYPANGQGVLQIVDPDMNLNPKAVDKFDTNVWSDSDSGGIKLTMTETGEATGIFQGTVYFTTNFQSSGNRLHVAEGDTVTGEYDDRTLPPPYTSADELRLTSTTFIGTVVPPLERAPASNPRIVDSFGNAITGAVKTGQQVQVTADLANGQDKDQPFAYLVQIQDANGVTVSLSWITGTLTAGQSLNPAQSWTPTASGTYTAQIFVWQSIDNPNALSPPLTTTINVA